MAFLDDNYLLENSTAVELYQHVKDLPIVDAHNHGNVKEILDNTGWSDIWEVEAATDHYVWESMRRRGVPEEKITGQAPNIEKWRALASIMPECAGNSFYEWTHLDLKRQFGIHEPLNRDNADDVWQATQEHLKRPEMRPQNLLKTMRVEIMCTTDEPSSRLEEHQQAADRLSGLRILPTWRPDGIMNIGKKSWTAAVERLGEATGTSVDALDGLLDAMEKSHRLFERNGCIAGDHGVLEPISHPVKEERVEKIYAKARSGRDLTGQEINDFMAFMMCRFGELNNASGWVTQIHIGALRDYRDMLSKTLGPDSGGDISTGSIDIAGGLRYFLNRFAEDGQIVLYCLDPTHLPTLATIARAFPNISLGAPWWFNDSPFGMEQHLRYAATVDLLSNHAGMVTDSRKIVSYGSRTEMFRRVLCNVVGDMEQKGQMPLSAAGDLVRRLSYERPLELFFGR